MMTSSNGNTFHVTGPLWGESSLHKRPVTRSFDIFFDLRLNKRLSKQSRCRWFETSPRSLWRQCNESSSPSSSWTHLSITVQPLSITHGRFPLTNRWISCQEFWPYCSSLYMPSAGITIPCKLTTVTLKEQTSTVNSLWLSDAQWSHRSGSTFPGCFFPRHSLNIELNMLPSDSLMSCLDSVLGYFTGEFQAL